MKNKERKNKRAYSHSFHDSSGMILARISLADGASLGATEGAPVGALEGAAVGAPVGAPVGSFVGLELGEPDGDSDGLTLGAELGALAVIHVSESPFKTFCPVSRDT